MSEHGLYAKDRTIVIRSIPLLVAEVAATVACFYYFPPFDLKGLVFCVFAVWVTAETFVGTRFTFQPRSVRVIEHFGRWPYRILYSEIGQVTQAYNRRRLYLNVKHRDQDITLGGWRSYVFPHVRRKVDEVRKEFNWRVLRAKD